MTTDTEIQRWTEQIKQYVPDEDVCGVLREGRGLLLRCRQCINAEHLAYLEAQFLKAGATRWDWQLDTARHIKIRVQWPKKRILWWWGLLAVAPLVYSVTYDIHLAENARIWFDQAARRNWF